METKTMFRCSQCEREFGGIRGVMADRCPRCAASARPDSSRLAALQSLADHRQLVPIASAGEAVAVARVANRPTPTFL